MNKYKKAVIGYFQKIANHLFLVSGDCEEYSDPIWRRIKEVADKILEDISVDVADPECSGKLLVLESILDNFDKEHDNVVVFSHPTKVLEILEASSFVSTNLG